MSDLLNEPPMESFDRGNPARRCTAHKKTGEQCRKWAIIGGSVCTHHGGRAPAVKRKALLRIEEAADRMARELLKMAIDDKVSDATKLAAIRDSLDRAGLSAKQAVGVELTVQPYEHLFDGIATGVSRAESRERRGLAAPDSEPVVDAEVVEDPAPPPSHATDGRTPADRADDPSHRPAFAEEPVGPPGNALMTMEEATAGLRQRINRRR